MALSSYFAFTLAFALVVTSPGPGLAAILSREVSNGLRSGLLVVCGLAIVDALFLGVAAIGLSAISVVLGPWFQFAKYIAAVYLIYLGIRMIFSESSDENRNENTVKHPAWKDIYLGCIVTLGNPKAIMFYAALLPTIFNVAEIGITEYLILCALMTLVTFFIYTLYIFFAVIAARKIRDESTKTVAKISGTSMIGIGVFIGVRE